MENQELQQKVFAIKSFYAQLLRYIGLSTLGIAIWMLSGGGYFWPIWVIILWGVSIAYDGYKLNLFKDHKKYQDAITNITKKWEEEQIKKIQEENEVKTTVKTTTGGGSTSKAANTSKSKKK